MCADWSCWPNFAHQVRINSGSSGKMQSGKEKENTVLGKRKAGEGENVKGNSIPPKEKSQKVREAGEVVRATACGRINILKEYARDMPSIKLEGEMVQGIHVYVQTSLFRTQKYPDKEDLCTGPTMVCMHKCGLTGMGIETRFKRAQDWDAMEKQIMVSMRMIRTYGLDRIATAVVGEY